LFFSIQDRILNADTIYNFIYDWVNLVVNTKGGRTIPIIRSHQNSPSPGDTYITIKYSTNRTKEGRPSIDTEITPGAEPTDPGTRNQYQDVLLDVEIWETGADGDFLNELQTSPELDDVLNFFVTHKVTYVTDNGVVASPRLLGSDKWKKESLLEVTLRVADITEESLYWIDDVEIEGTIPAQGRAGNHIVNI